MNMHPAIKLRHLRLFLATADQSSLTAAGRQLGLSQPALSKSLAELEGLLGARLFNRAGRRIMLTTEGEAFRRHARAGLASLDAAASAAQSKGAASRLSIGLLPTVSTRFFPSIMAQLLTEGPVPTLAVETGAHPILLQKLRNRQIDLMVGRMPAPAEMPGLAFEFLYDEPIIAIVRAGHPALGAPIRDILRDHPVILPPREAIIRATVDLWLTAQGMAGLVPAVETATLALGRGLVMATDAVWFISQGVVATELDAGLLIPLPLDASYLSGAVGMTVPEGHPLPAPLLRLMTLARTQAALQRKV